MHDRYRWERAQNGQETDIPSASGPLTYDTPSRANEGIYQCFATNGVGTAISNKTAAMFVTRAVFPDLPTPRIYSATVGDKLKLDCQPDFAGVPPPQYNDYAWHRSETKWKLDGRVQIDDSGMYVLHRARCRH